MSIQGLIDDGLHLCPNCESFGRHDFCGECGSRFFGAESTWRECGKCGVEATVPFCPMCGHELDNEELQRWEAGDVDLDEEGRCAQAQIDLLLKGNESLDRALYDGDFDGLAAERAQGGLAKMINEGFGNA